MPSFAKYEEISIETTISVDEFYCEMSKSEMKEMTSMLSKEITEGTDLMDILDPPPESMFEVLEIDKEKFYKNLAHHVGTTDSQFLEQFIEDLSYWSQDEK